MDLHDFKDVASNYDLYSNSLNNNKSPLGDNATQQFHCDLASKHGQDGILDIGCGTGLTTIPIAQKHNIIGIDISNAMIDELLMKAKSAGVKVDTLCSSMTNFDTRKNNSLAFIARTGFMHLLTTKDQKDCLLTIRNHLKPGGILSLNTFYPSYELITKYLQSKIDDYTLRTEYINARGNTEKIYNSNTYNPELQIVSGQWLFEEYHAEQIIDKRIRPLSIRMTFKTEMEHLFELTGFKVKEIFGDYEYNMPKYPGWLVWIVEKVS